MDTGETLYNELYLIPHHNNKTSITYLIFENKLWFFDILWQDLSMYDNNNYSSSNTKNDFPSSWNLIILAEYICIHYK